jgi:hypothetical protein
MRRVGSLLAVKVGARIAGIVVGWVLARHVLALEALLPGPRLNQHAADGEVFG